MKPDKEPELSDVSPEKQRAFPDDLQALAAGAGHAQLRELLEVWNAEENRARLRPARPDMRRVENWTPERRAAHVLRLSPEYREAHALKIREALRIRSEKMTSYPKKSKAARLRILTMTPEKREVWRANLSAGAKRWWRSITPEKRAAVRESLAESGRYHDMTPEEREALHKRRHEIPPEESIKGVR